MTVMESFFIFWGYLTTLVLYCFSTGKIDVNLNQLSSRIFAFILTWGKFPFESRHESNIIFVFYESLRNCYKMIHFAPSIAGINVDNGIFFTFSH